MKQVIVFCAIFGSLIWWAISMILENPDEAEGLDELP